MFFANEQRDNVREENPGISFGKHHSKELFSGYKLSRIHTSFAELIRIP